MDTRSAALSQTHAAVVERFVAACQTDERVIAAFLGGSYAHGAADAYSDLDLYVIASDEAYTEFFTQRAAFARLLGEPIFLEDFDADGVDLLLFVLATGAEGELGFGRASDFQRIHMGPHRVLVDKQGVLASATFPAFQVDWVQQVERLRGLIVWFWHDLSHHVITPLGRGQLWSAMGGLEALRATCVNLARLEADVDAEAAGYEKLEQTRVTERLAPLRATFCALERDAILGATFVVVQFYHELAPALAEAHDIPYPNALARDVCNRLEHLRDALSADAAAN